MPFKSSLKLNAKIFNPQERKRAFSRVPSKAARAFRDSTKKAMLESNPTGNLVKKRSGKGFQRFHRQSRRGERPSPDTLNLVNSITAQKTGGMSAKTQITAEYGARLQEDLNRPIMSDADVEKAEKDFVEIGKKTVQGLL